MRGLFRYETAPGRWWVCAEEENGERVNIVRERYEHMAIEPEFWSLPTENEDARKRGER